MRLGFFALFAMLMLCLSLASAAAPSVTAFHRSGQTFITWQDVKSERPVTYRVCRSDQPITEGNVSRAQLIAENVEPLSGRDFIVSRIAEKQKKVVEPRGFVIRPLRLPLPHGTGLHVHTVSKSGFSYYGVTCGPENTFLGSTGPVREKASAPEPYLEKVQVLMSGKVARTYIHWSDDHIAYREGIPFKFVVTTGRDVRKDIPAPMLLAIHAYSGYAMPSDAAAQDFIVVTPDDFTKGLPYEGYDWWYGYNSNLGGDLTKGTNVNYTERRLLYTMDFVRRQWNIDSNRIYLRGSSMGGTGAIAFGLRHPEIFAAIFANVPQVNPAMDNIGWSQHNIEMYCGTRAQAIKTNEGINVWDRMNMTKYVSEHKEDLPFLRTINARDDQVLKWPQIPGFLKAANESRHAFISGWGLGTHNIQPSQVPAVVKDFDIFRIRKDVSFPAFSNSSLNDDPGGGDPGEGAPTGQMGGGFDWTIVQDTSEMWEARISVLVEGKAEAVTDITPRRLQRFRPEPGHRYQWTNTDSSGRIVQEGSVTGDRWGLVTLPGVRVSASGSTVRLVRQ